MTDPGTRALARELVELRQRLARLELPSQGWARSVEESSLDFYDENGVLRASLGKQLDGSYGIRHAEGDIPPAPTEPDVMVISDGVVAVTWDGRWEERYSKVGWRNVQIHLGDTADFTPDRDTQVGAIFAPRGGTVVAVTESDDDNPVWVRLVGMNDAGQTGDPSVAVLVDELDEDDLDGEDEEQLEWEKDDYYFLTVDDITAGVATFPLSYIPETDSVLAVWAGVPQQPAAYSVDYDTKTITWPLSGFEKAGQRIWVHYAHLEGEPDVGAGTVLVDWSSGGWKYQQFAIDDTTNRSAPGYDDSAWATGTAPFGDEPVNHPYPEPFGATTTTWADETSLWLRRSVTVPAGLTAVTFSLRIDNLADVYVDGVLVGSRGPTNMSNPNVADITVSLSAGSRVVAVRAQDNAGGGSSDATYFDMQIRAEAP